MCERTQFGSRETERSVGGSRQKPKPTHETRCKKIKQNRKQSLKRFASWCTKCLAMAYGMDAWITCAARSQHHHPATSSSQKSTLFSRNGKMQLMFLFSPSFHSTPNSMRRCHRRNKNEQKKNTAKSVFIFVFLSLKTRSWAFAPALRRCELLQTCISFDETIFFCATFDVGRACIAWCVGSECDFFWTFSIFCDWQATVAFARNIFLVLCAVAASAGKRSRLNGTLHACDRACADDGDVGFAISANYKLVTNVRAWFHAKY